MYDVIVVGAGPAGCTAAKILAENGFRVLFTEKFKLPRYKSCSGQLIQKTLNLVEQYFGESTPYCVTCTPAENRGMIFTNDKGNEYRFEPPGLNVWRSSFDEWLARKAEQSGAELCDETAVLSCKEENDTVTVTFKGKSVYTEQARFVVDCEGVVGALKRKLLNNAPKYITTFQTYNQGSIDLDHHYFYAYLQPDFSEYDAWFNVKDGHLVLGVSVKGTGKTDYGVGRVLFAGEIAGFLNPMGEGISAGMESGYCAAQAIMQHFDDLKMVYSDYREKTKSLHGYMKRQWNFVAGIADTFSEMKLN